MIKRNDGISKDDICQNQFTAYVVLAVKRKRQSYIKKKEREHEKETRTKKESPLRKLLKKQDSKKKEWHLPIIEALKSCEPKWGM